jgi:hypothetical protein
MPNVSTQYAARQLFNAAPGSSYRQIESTAAQQKSDKSKMSRLCLSALPHRDSSPYVQLLQLPKKDMCDSVQNALGLSLTICRPIEVFIGDPQ